MCPLTPRKGKRFYDEDLANCGAVAANFNWGQTVASTYRTGAGVSVDGTDIDLSNDPQPSPRVSTFGISTGFDTDSANTKFGVNLNFPAVGNLGGQLPPLDNPTAPVVVGQLPVNEAGATENLSNTFTNSFSSRNRGTPNDQISYPWANIS